MALKVARKIKTKKNKNNWERPMKLKTLKTLAVAILASCISMTAASADILDTI